MLMLPKRLLKFRTKKDQPQVVQELLKLLGITPQPILKSREGRPTSLTTWLKKRKKKR
jgi:hypothetical protein